MPFSCFSAVIHVTSGALRSPVTFSCSVAQPNTLAPRWTFDDFRVEVLSSNLQLPRATGTSPCSRLEEHHVPSDSIGFHRIPSDSIGFHRITVSTVWIAFTTNLSSDDDPGSGCYDTPPWLFNLMITDRCCWNRLFNDLATLDAHTGYPYADGKLGTGICGTC